MAAERTEEVFHGIPAAPGVAHGPAFILVSGNVDIPQYKVPDEKLEEEISRFEQALVETRKQITLIRIEVEEKVGAEEASIFDAHQLVLEDRALIEDTIREVQETNFNIEYSFQKVANRYIEAFNQIDDDYIKERVADIRDVTNRLVLNLLGHDQGDRKAASETDHILIAIDLSPSKTAVLDIDKVLAIATDQGSRTSHSVIMARSLDIPSVVGLHNFTEHVSFGDHVLVDGFKGIVIINPSRETLERYGRVQLQRQHVQEKFNDERTMDCVTLDGHRIHLKLNIEGVESDSIFNNSGGEGVGLLRTENLYLTSEGFPDEEKQYQFYKRVIERAAPHSVTIRTLDLGGDKNPHRSLTGYTEANPFMGFRAIRFCLENIDVFKTQLRAILRASAHGKAQIMYPMISSVNELVAANECLDECMHELKAKGISFDKKIPRGSMIEIPSAAVISDLLAEHCDFFSIGTNDLIQYLLAVDRVNDRIAHLYEPSHPAVIRTLNFIFESGKKSRIPVSVCGELAGDPLYVAMLIGMGANELSVSWSAVAEIKFLIRHLNYRDAKKLALAVLRAPCRDQVKSLVETHYQSVLSPYLESIEG